MGAGVTPGWECSVFALRSDWVGAFRIRGIILRSEEIGLSGFSKSTAPASGRYCFAGDHLHGRAGRHIVVDPFRLTGEQPHTTAGSL